MRRPLRRRIRTARVPFALDRQCVLLGLPRPTAEYFFAAKQHLTRDGLAQIGQTKYRAWRIDWAFVPERLAVEVEGGYAAAGRHTRPSGFLSDLEKYNALAILGWRLVRVTPRQVRSGHAAVVIRRALTIPSALTTTPTPVKEGTDDDLRV